jgi:hypothetical protein
LCCSLSWNPALDSDCSGLYDGWWVCIAIQPQSVTVTFDYTVTATSAEIPDPTAWTPTTFPATDASFTATPTQAGIASDCKAFRQAKDVSDIILLCLLDHTDQGAF